MKSHSDSSDSSCEGRLAKATPRRRAPFGSGAWSYIVGEKGTNRIRVYERKPLVVWIDYRDERGQRVRQSLGTMNEGDAKAKAEEVAAQFRRQESAPARAVTLGALFDMYEREVTPTKSTTVQAHDRRTIGLFRRAFGDHRRADTLNRRDWDRYIQRRRSGELGVDGREGRSVRDRVLEQDCTLLKAILNWATDANDDAGRPLLMRNPLKRRKVPRDESPRRPMLTAEQYDAVRTAAASIHPRLECFVIVAWYTGHRSKSIRLLRWSDLDLEAGRARWRGENDKIGFEHPTPLHPAAVAALKAERSRSGGIGDAWVFPSARDRTKPLTEHAIVNLWKRIAVKAGMPPNERYGWHSFRRAFANALRDVPLRDLKDLGGWKSARTVVEIYQQGSEGAQRRALAALDGPAPASSGGTETHERAHGTGTEGR